MATGRGVSGVVVLPVLVGLYTLLTLKAGAIWFPGGRVVTRERTPKAFWSLVGLMVLAILGFLGVAVFWLVRDFI
jgi:hypothetical protein